VFGSIGHRDFIEKYGGFLMFMNVNGSIYQLTELEGFPALIDVSLEKDINQKNLNPPCFLWESIEIYGSSFF
jgi:hypothetical protein